MTALLERGRSRASNDLPARLDALAAAVRLGETRLDPRLLDDARRVVERAGERLRLSAAHTVVALAGATGSGKSSLFNALAGAGLSAVGLQRPTTSATAACVWDTDDDAAGANASADGDASGPLLDWLVVAQRHRLQSAEAGMDGLVLLDLPDHDSVVLEHRIEVDRLVKQVDLLAWVLDPQKYADAAVHDRYLRPLASHAAVLLVVFNQVDRLGQDAASRCLADLRELLAADGLAGVEVVATSAVTGEGLDALHARLAERVRRRRARTARIAADLDRVVEQLRGLCHDGTVGDLGAREEAALVEALAAAAGVPVVAGAVERSHRMRAVAATGWPFTRWVRRLRPDPLRRLHLGRAPSDGEAATPARTSLPQATPVQRSQAEIAVRTVADQAGGGLPPVWLAAVRRAARAHESDLSDALDAAVASADLQTRTPRWWTAAGFLQLLLAVAAVAGALWLGALAGVAYLQLPSPPTPRVSQIPAPTALLLGGLALGLVVAGLSRLAAAVGGRRRRARALARMCAAVAAVADRLVLDPVRRELAAYGELRSALAVAAGGRSSKRRSSGEARRDRHADAATAR